MTFTAYDLLETVRRQSPMVHHITNWVTIYDCAQIAKILGASPVMAHAPEEAGDMSALASALVLNIGTLTPQSVEAMKLAARAANAKGIPVTLDVCGAGATKLRDDKAAELLEQTRIDIIKGNASEIARVAGENIRTKGVDSTEVAADMAEIATRLAKARKATVVVTGATDIVADGTRVCRIGNGSPMMTHVVGTGCMAATVIGCFAAVEADHLHAATAALAVYGIAAELAAQSAQAPMAFKAALFDTLYTLDAATVAQRLKIAA